MNRDLNIKSTIRQILGVLISIMILMPFTVSSQTVTTTIDCANATTDINGNGYRWDLSNKILALDGIDLRTSQMMGIKLPPNSTITLQGDNYIEGASRAILFNIGSTEQDPGGTLTIKGDGTLTLNSTNTPSAIFNTGTSTIKNKAILVIESSTVITNGLSVGGNAKDENGEWGKTGETILRNNAWLDITWEKTTNPSGLPLYNHNIKVENSVLFYNYRNTGTLGYYGEVYGDVTLSGDCTIKNGQTLFIPTGCSLTVNGTLDNQGTIYSKGALTANQITGNTVTKDKVDLNGTSYKTWAEATAALAGSEEPVNIITLLDDETATSTPPKPCIITGDGKTLTYAGDLELQAALTFKSIKLNMSTIYANGHDLTFDESVDCRPSTYTNNGNTLTGIRNIWGGTKDNNTIDKTNIVIKSGQFGWIYGGGNAGNITGTTKVTISGGTVNNSVFGGSHAAGSTVDNTELNITGGTLNYIYGGGWNGDVTGTATTNISGDNTVVSGFIIGNTEGTGTAGNTDVTLDTSADNPIQEVHGAGINYNNTVHGKVSGNVNLTVLDGRITGSLIGCSSAVEGKININVKGGEVKRISGIDYSLSADSPTPTYSGIIQITIEKGHTTIGQIDSNNNHKTHVTYRNCGTADTPYLISELRSIDKVILENSFIKEKDQTSAFRLDMGNGETMEIEGTGLTGDFHLVNLNGKASDNQSIITASELSGTYSFTHKADNKMLYKAGFNYRYPGNATLCAITLPTTVENGTLALKGTIGADQGETLFENGDQVPAGTPMTIIATPSPGYSIKSFSVRQGNNNVTVDTDGSFTAPDGDFTVAAEFKRIYTPPAATYYTVTLPSVEGATLSKQAGDHTVEEGYSFTFAITLDENYSESIPVVTTDRGETIIPDTNGRYKINNVAEDIVVSISGIVKNLPTSIKSIETDTKIWTADGTIFIHTSSPQQIQVVNLAGSTLFYRNIPVGDTRLNGLAAGVYIVRFSREMPRKIIVR